MLAEDVSRNVMLDTSKDILYLVISFCILWLTVFLCWALYHFGKVLRNANEVVEEFRARMDALTHAIDFVRHRIEQISDLLTLATKGVSGYVSKMAGKKASRFFDDATGDMSAVAKTAVKKATQAVGKKIKSASRQAAKKTRKKKK